MKNEPIRMYTAGYLLKRLERRVRRITLICASMVSIGALSGQETPSTTETMTLDVQKNFYLGLGLRSGSFQDNKFSAERYSGSGATLQLGKQWVSDRYSWGVGFDGRFGSENAKTHDVGKTTTYSASLNGWYLHSLNGKWSVGGRLDGMDLYVRTIAGLNNNGTHILHGTHLFASAEYVTTVRDKWTLKAGIDLGLLSYFNESLGFAFSAPQVATEEGAFNYQNDDLSGFFGFEFFKVETLGRLYNIKTHAQLSGDSRFSLRYDWQLFSYTQVKDYPLIYGQHTLAVRYALTDNIKTRSITNTKRK